MPFSEAMNSDPLVRIYLVERELVGDQLPRLGNEVVGLSCLCV